MSEINRKAAPEVNVIEHVTLPIIEKVTLDNGIKLFGIPDAESEVLKFELVFKAGKWYETKNLVAGLAARMMREGTTERSGKQLADFFDYYGSDFSIDSGQETATIKLSCLSKDFIRQLPVVFEALTQSVFPEQELKTIVTVRKQSLAVALEKNDFISNRWFSKSLWGENHPFGRITNMEDFDQVNIEDLKLFAKSFYNSENCFVMLAGNYNQQIINEINNVFGQKNWLGNPALEIEYPILSSIDKVVHIDKEGSVQSAIQLGNITISKDHPDFIDFSVANTIFGGYFGSHLMANIREEKGYTYGIHSMIISSPHGSYFEISSEVGKDVCEATFIEIEKEIKVMQTELVDSEELETVKNYMSGRILRSVDGFNRFSTMLKLLLITEQDENYIQESLTRIRNVTAEKVLQVSQNYLDLEKMYRVDVG